MTNRKNYNSILFLTVYFGLVLVGGSAQVLAQTDLSNFAQIKRDNKFICPNSGLIEDEIGKEINPFEYGFAERLIELIETTNVRIKIVEEIEKETATLPFFFKQTDFAPYLNRKGKLIDYDWGSDSSEWASAAHAGQISELHRLFLTPLCDCSKPSKQKSILNSSSLKIDNNWLVSEFKVKKVSKYRAEQLASTLKQIFDSRTLTANQAINEVYKKTQVYAQNNQVFIVTRLPRASIDSLLK
jgi:hypothetical protein